MPVHGTRDFTSLELPPQTVTSEDLASAALTAPDAEVLQLMFEVDDRTVLDLIPRSMRQTIPPMATFIFWRWGRPRDGDEFTMAQARVMCRAGVRSRGILLAAYYTGPASVPATLRAGWGFDCKDGDVRLRQFHDRIVGEVKVNGRTILHAELEDPNPTATDDVEYAVNLNIARIRRSGDERPMLLQVEPEYRVEQAVRGRPHVATFDTSAWTADGLSLTNPVSALYYRGTLRLPPIRYVIDPDLPLERGTELVRS